MPYGHSLPSHSVHKWARTLCSLKVWTTFCLSQVAASTPRVLSSHSGVKCVLSVPSFEWHRRKVSELRYSKLFNAHELMCSLRRSRHNHHSGCSLFLHWLVLAAVGELGPGYRRDPLTQFSISTGCSSSGTSSHSLCPPNSHLFYF